MTNTPPDGIEFTDFDRSWLREVSAVGVRKDGGLIPITDPNDFVGAQFSAIILAPKHRVWFKENETELRNSLGPNGNVIIFGTSDSILEIF